MTDIGIGIIGAGYMGSTHSSHYAALTGVRVLGVCDVDDAASARLAATLGPDTLTFTDVERLVALPGLDAVSVCTPDGDHRLPVEAAATAGVHILLEKAIATDLADAHAMLDAVAAANVTLAMGFVSRYLNTYNAAHEALTAGAVGSIISIGVRRFNSQQAGVKYHQRDDVIDFLAVHDIDILRWFGGEITSVSAMADAFVFTDSPHADTAQMLLRFASGAIGHLHVSWAYPDAVPGRARSGIDIVGLPMSPSRPGARICPHGPPRGRSRLSGSSPPSPGPRRHHRGARVPRGRPVSLDQVAPVQHRPPRRPHRLENRRRVM